MRTLSLCLTVLVLGSAAPALALAHPSQHERGEADLAKEIAGRVAGKPVDCLPLSRIDGSTIVDRTAIVYRGLGGMIWVNRPRGAEMLRDDDVPVQIVYGSQLCKLDRIKLLDRSTRMERGFVGLDVFVPYTKPGKAAR
jgi:hypothetical protein